MNASAPVFCAAVCVAAASLLLASSSRSPSDRQWDASFQGIDREPLVVRLGVQDFRWRVTFPGPDGVFESGDDIVTGEELKLPAGRAVRLQLESRDYIYAFAVPSLGLNEVAVPGLVHAFEFERLSPGVVPVQAAEFCGGLHPDVSGSIVVQSSSDFARWLRAAAVDTRRATSRL